jgi:hypothetical protein
VPGASCAALDEERQELALFVGELTTDCCIEKRASFFERPGPIAQRLFASQVLRLYARAPPMPEVAGNVLKIF